MWPAAVCVFCVSGVSVLGMPTSLLSGLLTTGISPAHAAWPALAVYVAGDGCAISAGSSVPPLPELTGWDSTKVPAAYCSHSSNQESPGDRRRQTLRRTRRIYTAIEPVFSESGNVPPGVVVSSFSELMCPRLLLSAVPAWTLLVHVVATLSLYVPCAVVIMLSIFSQILSINTP